MIISLFFFLTLAHANSDFFDDIALIQSRSISHNTEQGKLNAANTKLISKAMQFTPSISLGAGKSASKNVNESGAISKSSGNYWKASADWNLFRSGADLSAWRGSAYEREAQEMRMQLQDINSERAAAEAIFQKIYLRESFEAENEKLHLKQEGMRIGKDRYRQGKISLQEVIKMEVDLSQQESALRNAEIAIAQNEVVYKTLFVDELKTKEWPFKEKKYISYSEPKVSLTSKVARANAEADRFKWISSSLQHGPSIDFNLSYKETPFKSPNNQQWFGSLDLTFPIWNRFEIASASALAHSNYVASNGDALEKEREDSLKAGFLNKKLALELENLKATKLNQEKSKKLYADMLFSFQLGRLSTNDLFLEQDRNILALRLYSNSRLSYHQTIMESCGLLGLEIRNCIDEIDK